MKELNVNLSQIDFHQIHFIPFPQTPCSHSYTSRHFLTCHTLKTPTSMEHPILGFWAIHQTQTQTQTPLIQTMSSITLHPTSSSSSSLLYRQYSSHSFAAFSRLPISSVSFRTNFSSKRRLSLRIRALDNSSSQSNSFNDNNKNVGNSTSGDSNSSSDESTVCLFSIISHVVVMFLFLIDWYSVFFGWYPLLYWAWFRAIFCLILCFNMFVLDNLCWIWLIEHSNFVFNWLILRFIWWLYLH